ncbi:hypothetical protein AZSI13_07580 [Azospira sp. I13]|nr:hypothetical protein AZSI13_07580 [Azospira sp. I13]
MPLVVTERDLTHIHVEHFARVMGDKATRTGNEPIRKVLGRLPALHIDANMGRAAGARGIAQEEPSEVIQFAFHDFDRARKKPMGRTLDFEMGKIFVLFGVTGLEKNDQAEVGILKAELVTGGTTRTDHPDMTAEFDAFPEAFAVKPFNDLELLQDYFPGIELLDGIQAAMNDFYAGQVDLT